MDLFILLLSLLFECLVISSWFFFFQFWKPVARIQLDSLAAPLFAVDLHLSSHSLAVDYSAALAPVHACVRVGECVFLCACACLSMHACACVRVCACKSGSRSLRRRDVTLSGVILCGMCVRLHMCVYLHSFHCAYVFVVRV